jgi:predicted component of type VI protein secretion system
MAFIIVADNKSREIERRELAGPVVIGRSPECDLAIRDILLSRRHCAMERIGEAWVVADLGSKNGTFVHGELINRHVLQDGEVIRIGRTRICFREGRFIPTPPNTPSAKHRPADPLEALAGTLSAFRFSEDEVQELDQHVLETFPRPQPKPMDPRAYQSEHVQAMIADIASSAWDSVLTETERVKTKPLPRPMLRPVYVEIPAPRVEPKRVTKRRRRLTMQGAMAVFYIALSVAVTGTAVWVISWSW